MKLEEEYKQRLACKKAIKLTKGSGTKACSNIMAKDLKKPGFLKKNKMTFYLRILGCTL
jgi:hypothetical protein